VKVLSSVFISAVVSFAEIMNTHSLFIAPSRVILSVVTLSSSFMFVKVIILLLLVDVVEVVLPVPVDPVPVVSSSLLFRNSSPLFLMNHSLARKKLSRFPFWAARSISSFASLREIVIFCHFPMRVVFQKRFDISAFPLSI